MTDNNIPANPLGVLVAQLDALRAEVAALRSDFDAAKVEGAEQVEDLRATDQRIASASVAGLDDMAARISAAREYTELLNQRRSESIDKLQRAIASARDDVWAVRVDLEKKVEDATRAMRRW
jgi:hypothetical protein